MSFFVAWYRSIVDLRWLRTQRKETNKAWMYAIFFLLVMGVVRDSYLLWGIPSFIHEARTGIAQSLPNFRAEIKNGELIVTDLPQPYTYRLPTEDGDVALKVVVDTLSTSTPAISDITPSDEETVVLITKTAMTIRSDGGRTQTQEWRTMPDGTLTKEQVTNFLQYWAGRIGYFIAPVLIVLFFIFGTLGKLIYLALLSLVVWLVTLFAKRDWKYKEIFTVGLFALTAPTMLQILLFWSGLHIPFVYSVVLAAYLFAVVFGRFEATEVYKETPPPVV